MSRRSTSAPCRCFVLLGADRTTSLSKVPAISAVTDIPPSCENVWQAASDAQPDRKSADHGQATTAFPCQIGGRTPADRKTARSAETPCRFPGHRRSGRRRDTNVRIGRDGPVIGDCGVAAHPLIISAAEDSKRNACRAPRGGNPSPTQIWGHANPLSVLTFNAAPAHSK